MFFFSSRRRHTRCALVTGVQTCARPIYPVQVAIPHVGDNFCWNHDMARSTRRTVLERVADRSALLLGSHFAGPTGVYLKPDGEAWIVDQAGSAEDGTKVPSPA